MRARWLVALALVGLAGRAEGAISGTVVDQRGVPVAAARVRVQGTTGMTETDAQGRFDLSATSGTITAAKEGFLGAARRVRGAGLLRLVLPPLPRPEPTAHAFTAARGPEPGACARCHPAIAAQWEASAHARAARDPLFLAVYDGDTRAPAAPAYRRDFPESAGNCATCHAPALAIDAPFASDPLGATGAAAEGVTCDLCHAVQAARVDPSGGKPGVLSLTLLRPRRGHEVLFGPLDDVTARPDAYQPIYRRSEFCAPCHQARFWNVGAYSEYEEWAASDYARQGVQCQDCHMRALAGPPRRIATAETGGLLRDARTLPSHALDATDDIALMRGAIDLQTEATLERDGLHVRVDVHNAGAGHHFPTGSPLRNLVLLVEATDARDRPLPLLAGPRLPRWAGEGAPADGNYAGLPGRGFAKVLAEAGAYGAEGRGQRFAPAYPAPFWRPAVLVADTRLPAGARDLSEYRFAASGPVRVRARLIYRRSFRSWGLDGIAGELELARTETSIDGRALASRQGRGP